VVRAAEDYVRIIVRRPHAYFFITDLFNNRGGIKTATPQGTTLTDGSSAPLPGIYVLDSAGKYEASAEISKADLVEILAGS
jgi:hypothetical protein